MESAQFNFVRLAGSGARDGVKVMQKVNSSVSQDVNVWIIQRRYFPPSFYLLRELSLMHLFPKVAVEGLQMQ